MKRENILRIQRTRFSDHSILIVLRVLICFALAPSAQAGRRSVEEEGGHPNLAGVYRLLDAASLPRGLKNTGSPDKLPLQPDALTLAKTRTPKDDVAKLCLPVGPFRMMAWDGNKIDIYQSPGRITMLFENIYLGHMRTFYLDRPHTQGVPLWEGDSIAHWEKDTLIVNTINFNNYTWLNGNGAPHSDSLHLTERYRLAENGKYLEVTVAAEDPKVLTRPYSYRRYYEKVHKEIRESVCWDDVTTAEP